MKRSIWDWLWGGIYDAPAVALALVEWVTGRWSK